MEFHFHLILVFIFTFKMSVWEGIDFRHLESLVWKVPLSLTRERGEGGTDHLRSHRWAVRLTLKGILALLQNCVIKEFHEIWFQLCTQCFKNSLKPTSKFTIPAPESIFVLAVGTISYFSPSSWQTHHRDKHRTNHTWLPGLWTEHRQVLVPRNPREVI